MAHSVVPVAVLSLLTLSVARQSLLDFADRAVEAEITLAASLIEGLLNQSASDLSFLHETIQLSGGEVGDDLQRTFLDLARRHPEYRQVRWVGKDGIELVRVNHRRRSSPQITEQLQDKSDRYYIQEALQLSPREIYLSPIDLNMEGGRPETPARYVFRIASTVTAEDGSEQGVLVINIEAEEILQTLRTLHTDSESATWVLSGEQSYLRESAPSGRPILVVGSVRDGQALELSKIGQGLVGSSVIRRGDSLVGIMRLDLQARWVGELWTLAHEQPTSAVLGSVTHLPGWLSTFAVLLGMGALVLAFLAARSLSAPIRQLTEASRLLVRGEFDPALRVNTGDEIEDLGEVLREAGMELAQARSQLEKANEHLRAELQRQAEEVRRLLDERMEHERHLLQADRLASIGLMSASLAHEIGNPLAGMKTNLQVAMRGLSLEDPIRRSLDRTLTEVNRLTVILRKWTGFARPPAERANTTPREVLGRVWSLLRTRALRRGITLTIEGDGLDDPLRVDGVAMEQVCLNILLNALEAQDDPGPLQVEACRTAGELELVFDDAGPGIPEADRGRIFDAFHTTKSGGTGLGLAIVWKIVAGTGGTVEVSESPAGGARLIVRVQTGNSE